MSARRCSIAPAPASAPRRPARRRPLVSPNCWTASRDLRTRCRAVALPLGACVSAWAPPRRLLAGATAAGLCCGQCRHGSRTHDRGERDRAARPISTSRSSWQPTSTRALFVDPAPVVPGAGLSCLRSRIAAGGQNAAGSATALAMLPLLHKGNARPRPRARNGHGPSGSSGWASPASRRRLRCASATSTPRSAAALQARVSSWRARCWCTTR